MTDVFQFPTNSFERILLLLNGKYGFLLFKALCCGIESYIWKVCTGIFSPGRSLSAVIFTWE